MLAPKKARSTQRKSAVTATAAHIGHFQSRRATTKARRVVISIVVVTATP